MERMQRKLQETSTKHSETSQLKFVQYSGGLQGFEMEMKVVWSSNIMGGNKFDDVRLRTVVEADPGTTVRRLAKKLGTGKSIISTHLSRIGKRKSWISLCRMNSLKPNRIVVPKFVHP